MRHVDGVHLQQPVAGAEASPVSRAVLERLGHVRAAVLIQQQGADAGIFAGGHLADVLAVLLGIIYGIRVNRLQHRVDGVLECRLRIDGVHIVHFQLLDYGAERVQTAGHRHVLAFLRTHYSGRHDGGTQQCASDNPFHILYNNRWSLCIILNRGYLCG